MEQRAARRELAAHRPEKEARGGESGPHGQKPESHRGEGAQFPVSPDVDATTPEPHDLNIEVLARKPKFTSANLEARCGNVEPDRCSAEVQRREAEPGGVETEVRGTE